MSKEDESKQASEKPAGRDIQWWATVIGIVATVVSIIATIIGIGPDILPKLKPPTPSPQVMTGDFNVAIAEFGQGAEMKESETGRALRRWLRDSLWEDLSPLDVTVEMQEIGIVGDEGKAREISEEINATLVIYGWFLPEDDRKTFTPYFYVKEFPETEELAGEHRLGPPFTTSTSFEASDEIDKRRKTLVSFTIGLVYLLETKNYDEAVKHFEEAIQVIEEKEEGRRDLEVFHFFLGRALAAQNDPARALEEFQEALAINPKYARAYIGIGNIYYDRGTKEPQAIDVSELDRAAAEYQKALALGLAGDHALGKAHVALGNIYSLKAQIGLGEEYFAEAMVEYQEAIALYERIGGRVLYPANAYYGLGVVYERKGELEKAAQEYQRCIDYAGDDPALADLKELAEERLHVVQ